MRLRGIVQVRELPLPRDARLHPGGEDLAEPAPAQPRPQGDPNQWSLGYCTATVSEMRPSGAVMLQDITKEFQNWEYSGTQVLVLCRVSCTALH